MITLEVNKMKLFKYVILSILLITTSCISKKKCNTFGSNYIIDTNYECIIHLINIYKTSNDKNVKEYIDNVFNKSLENIKRTEKFIENNEKKFSNKDILMKKLELTETTIILFYKIQDQKKEKIY